MRNYLFLLLLFVLFIFSFACKERTDYKQLVTDPMLYCKTVKKLNDVVLNNNFPPMIASRNYAYANIAAYECIVAGDSSYRTLTGQIKHMPRMPQPPANTQIDYSLAALLSFIKVGNAVTFPEGVLMDYYDQLKKDAEEAGIPDEMLKNTIIYADAVSLAVMEWARKDNYAETRSAEKFTVMNEDGRWVPTPPMYAQGLEPHWCEIRPLLLDSAAQLEAAAPPKYEVKNKSSAYYKEVVEVKGEVDSLTDEQKHIADFFDDNPFQMNVTGHVMFATKKFSPPGHWMNITGIAAKKAGADFNSTVAAYTKTAIALYDGFITCWKTKYKTNTVRPETVINKLIDPEWRPYIQTPPFPSYVSGHSVISAAAAEVLSQQFGDHFQYTDTSQIEFGIPSRSFSSFRDAALEASWSRLYGGIHFRSDLVEGNRIGVDLGKHVVTQLQLNKKTDVLKEKEPIALKKLPVVP